MQNQDRCIHRCHHNDQGCTKTEALERDCACGFFCFYTPCDPTCEDHREAT